MSFLPPRDADRDRDFLFRPRDRVRLRVRDLLLFFFRSRLRLRDLVRERRLPDRDRDRPPVFLFLASGTVLALPVSRPAGLRRASADFLPPSGGLFCDNCINFSCRKFRGLPSISRLLLSPRGSSGVWGRLRDLERERRRQRAERDRDRDQDRVSEPESLRRLRPPLLERRLRRAGDDERRRERLREPPLDLLLPRTIATV